MSAHRLKADSIAKRLRRVLQSASHEYFDPLEIGGEGGIRTHGTVNRTTAFEF